MINWSYLDPHTLFLVGIVADFHLELVNRLLGLSEVDREKLGVITLGEVFTRKTVAKTLSVFVEAGEFFYFVRFPFFILSNIASII